jgi:hypothetical protein
MKKFTARESRINEIPGDLWILSAKIRGLSDLFRIARGEPLQEEAFHGISYLMAEIADEIEQIHELMTN